MDIKESTKDWDAYYDARTLMSAEKIKGDAVRLDKAKKEAERIVKEQEEEKRIATKISKLKGGK